MAKEFKNDVENDCEYVAMKQFSYKKKKQFSVHIRLLIMRVDNFRRSLVSRFQGPLLYPSSLLSKSRTSFCSEYHAYQFTYSAVLLRARVHANNRY